MNRKVYSVVILALCLVLLAAGVVQAAWYQPGKTGRTRIADGKVDSTDALIVMSCVDGVDCRRSSAELRRR